jgi:hypothetical protein
MSTARLAQNGVICNVMLCLNKMVAYGAAESHSHVELDRYVFFLFRRTCRELSIVSEKGMRGGGGVLARTGTHNQFSPS